MLLFVVGCCCKLLLFSVVTVGVAVTVDFVVAANCCNLVVVAVDVAVAVDFVTVVTVDVLLLLVAVHFG